MGSMYENQTILCKETGEICYISEMGDSDDLPDDVDESEKYIEIPHKNELDLGKNLVSQPDPASNLCSNTILDAICILSVL